MGAERKTGSGRCCFSFRRVTTELFVRLSRPKCLSSSCLCLLLSCVTWDGLPPPLAAFPPPLSALGPIEDRGNYQGGSSFGLSPQNLLICSIIESHGAVTIVCRTAEQPLRTDSDTAVQHTQGIVPSSHSRANISKSVKSTVPFPSSSAPSQ